MGKERKDTKDRILHTGESQDKSGRYWYKWTDQTGKRHAISSWRLTKADKVPAGKRDCKPLREMEGPAKKDTMDGIVFSNLTVNELLDNHIKLLKTIKPETRRFYRTKADQIKKSRYGNLKVKNFKSTTARAFISRLIDDGMKYSTIKAYYVLMKAAFDKAVEDDIIRKNPFCFKLSSMCRNDAEKRNALTPDQEGNFLEYVRDHNVYKVYYDGIYILLNTGLRISEFCGITRDDIDFENGFLHVKKQLKKHDGLSNEPRLTSLKTDSGDRTIPLDHDLLECFKHCYSGINYTYSIDGYRGFLYYTQKGIPYGGHDWDCILQRAVKAYNKSHDEQLPHISPHVLRHTFCTKMYKAGCSTKSIQAIMGHAKPDMTLGVYTHVKDDQDYIKAELEKMTV